MTPEFVQAQLRNYLSLFPLPVEVRVPVSKVRIISGYYDDLDKLVEACAYLSGNIVDRNAKVETVYTTLNPFDERLVNRSHNRLTYWAKLTTSDKDITHRMWLPIDYDSGKPAGICATDAEHEAALAVTHVIRQYLTDHGFPQPIFGDSGNGGHLLNRVNLPKNEAMTALFSEFLQHLAKRFDEKLDENNPDKYRSGVDKTVFNASRIWKAYGTKVCKGDEAPNNPHRYARILEMPADLCVVEEGLIRKLVDSDKSPAHSLPPNQNKPAEKNATDGDPKAFVDHFVVVHTIIIVWVKPDNGKWLWRGGVTCPFCGHTDACITINPRNQIGYCCPHNSCNGNTGAKKTWRDYRRHYEPDAPADGKPRKESPVRRLSEHAMANCELFTTPDQDPYAAIQWQGRMETARVRSKTYKRWLAEQAETLGFPASRKTIDDTLNTLESRAFRGERHEVHLRVARHGNDLYLDLCDALGRVVQITAGGWTITTDCPVRFVRPENMAPLPVPERGGSLDELRPFARVADEDFPLVRGLILDAFKGVGPYLGGLFNGEQDSAKTSLCRRLKQITDPAHKAGVRRLQRDEYELALAAERNAVLCFDNVSSLPQWLSDALASLLTGTGFGVREMYNQESERVYGAARPVLFNGIPDFAESADLLDRMVRVHCLPIPPEAKRDEVQLEEVWSPAYPRILGAVCDLLSNGLKHYATTHLATRQRMARSERWITACETGTPGTHFSAAYARNRAELNDLALDASVVASTLIHHLDAAELTTWEGTAADLLMTLADRTHGLTTWSPKFPRLPHQLSQELRRVAPALRKVGVIVRFARSKKQRTISLAREVPASDAGDARVTPSDAEMRGCLSFPLNKKEKGERQEHRGGEERRGRIPASPASPVRHHPRRAGTEPTQEPLSVYTGGVFTDRPYRLSTDAEGTTRAVFRLSKRQCPN